MDAVGSSETALNSYQATRLHAPGGSIINFFDLYGCENRCLTL